MGSNSIDDLLANFGDPGRYQKCVFAMLICGIFTISFNNMMTLFNMVSNPHHCKVPDGISLNDSIPRLDNGEFDSCSMYLNFSDHSAGITDCIDGWSHYPKNGKWSIVQEWDLVCDKHYRAALTNSMYFFGVTIGCGLFGYLGDKIGRRPVILMCLYTYFVLGIGIAFVQNYFTYVTFRCLEGIVLQGVFGTSYAMSIEVFLPHRRNTVAYLLQVLWPVTIFSVTVLDYFVKNWRTFHLIISVPFAFTFAYFWFLPESPRWLIAMNKVDRAKDQLKAFARYNCIPVPPNLESEITRVIEHNKQTKSAVPRTYGFLDLFRTKLMFIISFAAFFYSFVYCFAFYAIAYSMMTTGSDVHFSNIITSFIDAGFNTVTYFALLRTTRKRILYVIITFVTTISLLVTILQSLLPANNTSFLVITITAGLGRAGIAGIFTVMPVYVSEMSPTVIRTMVMGMANLWGRIAGVIAPQAMILEKHVWKPLPFLLCACMAFLSLLITIPLPETKNKPLQDLPEDIGKLWKDEEKSNEDQEMTKPIVNSVDDGL